MNPTPRAPAPEAAPTAAAWLASVVQCSADAIIAEVDGVVVSWNPAAAALYGWLPEEITGKPVGLLVPPERGDELVRILSRIRLGERIHDLAAEHRRKDGQRIRVLLTVSPVLDAEGRVLGSSLIARDVTERERAEARVRESEQRYRELVEQASDAIFIADLEGRYRDVNPAACRLLGSPRDEIVGLTIMDLLPPEELPRLVAARERMLAQPGRAELSEWRLRRKDGTFVQVEVSAKILPDGRWQAIVRDITGRKRVEAEQARAGENERRLRAQLEAVGRASGAISEAIARLPELGLRNVLHTVARQAQALTGARYVAVGLGSDPERSFDPWVYAGMSELDEAIIGQPPRPVGTLGRVACDGEVVRVADVRRHEAFRGLPRHHPELKSFLGVPIRHRGEAEGNLYLAEKEGGGPFTDADVRTVELLAQRAGVALETARLYDAELTARGFLQAVIDQMPEGVLVLDAQGRVVHCNRAALALSCGDTGARDAFGNAVIFDLRTPEGTPLPFEDIPVVRALRERRRFTGLEIAVMTPGGRLVPVQASVAPLRGARGEAAGAVALFQDVSEAKEQKRVREEWISVMAHDLRQPVNIVAVCAHNLRRLRAGLPPGKEDEITESLQAAAATLNRLLDDLLDVSLIGAHRLALERIEIDARTLVQRTAARVMAAHPEARVAVRASGEPVRISVDPHRIEQVLANLIGNAVKYGTPGTEIGVGVEGRGGEAWVSVTNAGRGIAAAELPHVFNPFVRSQSSRQLAIPGLGLGLYICKGIVEAHGGRIFVESTPGETTTFRFTLPAAGPAPGQAHA